MLNGTGTQANPWKELWDIDWSVVQSVLSTDRVNLVLSSRSVWRGGYFTIRASGSRAGNTLHVIGDQQFNTVTAGAAIWQSETNGRRAVIAGTGTTGGTTYIDSGRSNIVLQGLELSRPTWGGIVLGQENPATNIKFITVTNCFVHDVVNSTGISMLYGETGCHSITVSHCIVSNIPAEGIYLGHYNYLAPTITNCVVEHNKVIDAGHEGEGDIDIKPGVKGAIVRYNTHYRSASLPGGNCGVAVLASSCQIYGNTFHHAGMKSDQDWGYGIYISADGDALGNGQSITNCLIYNNLLYANGRCGLKLIATTSTSGADIRGVRIWNNTIWGNSIYGVQAGAWNGRIIEILEFKNNIVADNGSYDVHLAGNVSLLSADNNMYFRASGTCFYFNGEKTFDSWRASGLDSNGRLANPDFQNAVVGDFELRVDSTAVDNGVVASFFTSDIRGRPRGVVGGWEIGAFEFVRPAPPANLRLVDTDIP